jgi:hypothetical protein
LVIVVRKVVSRGKQGPKKARFLRVFSPQKCLARKKAADSLASLLVHSGLTALTMIDTIQVPKKKSCELFISLFREMKTSAIGVSVTTSQIRVNYEIIGRWET